MHFRPIPVAIATLFATTLTGCGGGGSGTSISTGVLSDSYVKGVSYTATPSGKTGTTGFNGEFNYASGDNVTFKIGNVTLGSVSMASTGLGMSGSNIMIRPKDLAGVTDETDEKSLAIAQFIQTLAGVTEINAASLTNLDVSSKASKFTKTTTIAKLDDVATLLAKPDGTTTTGSLTPVALDVVNKHLLSAPTQVKSVEFTSTDVANMTNAQRAIAYTTSSAVVSYADGSSKTFPLSYVNLYNNTDKVDANGIPTTANTGVAAAAIRDKNGDLIKDANQNAFVPQTPDGTSLLDISGTPYVLTNWEYVNVDSAGTGQYGKVPMTMTVAKASQSKTDGKLTVSTIKQVNFSGVNGLWISCGSARSPWNTHLSSEEYEPDARCAVDNDYMTNNNNCKDNGTSGGAFTARMNAFRTLYKDTTASPYNYGRVPEVTVNVDGTTSVEKWYTLGRLSREKVQFFGDSRTAIQGDDGTYTMLTMFIADKAKDLSAGSLYAAKWTQVSKAGAGTNVNGGKGALSWIKLGSATHDTIKSAVDAGVTFSDLFETSTIAAAGFTTVTHGHEASTTEYLKLKSGAFNGVAIATLAAFLETRRYAAMLGATTEFEKYEGVAYNAKDNKAYVALSSIAGGMSDTAGDVQLTAVSSGAVYELVLQSAQKEKDSATSIDSAFVPVSMEAIVVGEDMSADSEGNNSVLSKISRPDNLSFSDRMRVLFIGEDSGRHMNNYLWAYHLDTGKLVRILSLPMGAESTGLQVVDNMNGFAYIMSNYQHAGDKNSTQNSGTALTLYNNVKALLNVDKAEVGYLGGLPAMR